MSAPQRIPYGSWPSPITADRAAEASVVLSETKAIGDASCGPRNAVVPSSCVRIQVGSRST